MNHHHCMSNECCHSKDTGYHSKHHDYICTSNTNGATLQYNQELCQSSPSISETSWKSSEYVPLGKQHYDSTSSNGYKKSFVDNHHPGELLQTLLEKKDEVHYFPDYITRFGSTPSSPTSTQSDTSIDMMASSPTFDGFNSSFNSHHAALYYLVDSSATETVYRQNFVQYQQQQKQQKEHQQQLQLYHQQNQLPNQHQQNQHQQNQHQNQHYQHQHQQYQHQHQHYQHQHQQNHHQQNQHQQNQHQQNQHQQNQHQNQHYQHQHQHYQHRPGYPEQHQNQAQYEFIQQHYSLSNMSSSAQNQPNHHQQYHHQYQQQQQQQQQTRTNQVVRKHHSLTQNVTPHQHSNSSTMIPVSSFKSYKNQLQPKRKRNTNRRTLPSQLICPTCSRIFTRPYNLKSHQRTHTNERPFKCVRPGCSWAFARPHDLKRHDLLHSGIKNFLCSCGKPFARSDAFKRHQAVDKVCSLRLKRNYI